MNTVIKPGMARGTVTVPPSKSMAHRLLIAAGLSCGESRISNVELSQDILATLDCLRALGATVDVDEVDRAIRIIGTDPRALVGDHTVLDCRESGSTMRFMIPLALLSDARVRFVGKGRLLERPMTIYQQICEEQSLMYTHGGDSIDVRGPLNASTYHIPGDVSSQFITGLLFALPLVEGESHIRLTTPLESKPYIDLTLSALLSADIQIEEIGDIGYDIYGKQTYRSISQTVEGDYSNAAFVEALNLIGGNVNVVGLSEHSCQGDKAYRTYFREMTDGMPTLDIRDCPDLAPILMTMGAALHGVRLQGTRRLKIKESDRGVVMARELEKFGAKISLYDNEIVVHPSNLMRPKERLDGHNDHRVVMSLAVLATKFGGEIAGSQAVSKSYPSFFDMLQSVGIDLEHTE